MANTLLKMTDILDAYAAGSGQQTRRRWHLPTLEYNKIYSNLETDSNVFSTLGVSPDGFKNADTVGGFMAPLSSDDHVVYVSARQERWFSGAYTYYLPPYGSFDRYRSLANKLFGSDLTPEVLWNLSPWSWLADWNLQISSSIAAAQRFQNDNLVLRYGYLMVRDRVTVSSNYSIKGISPQDTPFTRAGYTHVHYDRKRRVKSTPFGFGMNPTTDFNPFQWSILAALGMTKAPRVLG
jgi:hypothetical protein